MNETTRGRIVLVGSILLIAITFLGARPVDWPRIATPVVAACLVVLWRAVSPIGVIRRLRWKIAGWGALAAVAAVVVVEALRGVTSSQAFGVSVGTAAFHGAIASQGMLALVLLFATRASPSQLNRSASAADPPAEEGFLPYRKGLIAAGVVLLALIGLAAANSNADATGTWVRIDQPQFRFTIQESESGGIAGSGGTGTSTSAASFDVTGRRVGSNISLVLQIGQRSRAGFEGTIVDDDWLYGTFYVEGRAPSEVQFHRE